MAVGIMKVGLGTPAVGNLKMTEILLTPLLLGDIPKWQAKAVSEGLLQDRHDCCRAVASLRIATA